MSKRLRQADLTPEQVLVRQANHRRNYLKNRLKMIEQSKASQARRWAEDPERMRAKASTWRRTQRMSKTKEERREEWRRTYAKHCERIKARSRAYAKSHRDSINASRKQYFKDHPGASAAYTRRHYLLHREEILLRKRIKYHQNKYGNAV